MTSSALGSLLHGTVDALRSTTGLPVVFAGTATPGGLRLGPASGMRTGSLDGLLVERNEGLGGRAMQIRRPIAVAEYRTAPAISHPYDRQVATEGLVSMVAVPVVVERSIPVVLYGALRRSGRLGDVAVGGLVAAADRLARTLAGPRSTGAAEPPLPGPGRLAGLVSEVRTFADTVTDPDLRTDLLACCDRLTATDPTPGPTTLTPRELDVLALVAGGCTNDVVANLLDTTPDAVKAHLRKAMQRLGARSRHAAVSVARARGLLP